MDSSQLRMVTLRDRPDLQPAISKLAAQAWPEFMMHDPATEKHWHLIYEHFPEYQLLLLKDNHEPVAAGNSVPLPWDDTLENLPDTGIDWILSALAENTAFRHANQFALQVLIRRDHLGQGLSTIAVRAMGEIGTRNGCRNLLAPVRPNRKCDYPLTPMERYVKWVREDGLPFDPWMRVHARLGASIVKVCPRSMYIPGTIAQWEQWTGLPLPESGPYIISGALVPIVVDYEKDLGEYLEPNVWMQHPLHRP